jgi:hypothetical protein
MSEISMALDKLRDAIFEAHHVLATERKRPPVDTQGTRLDALDAIDEILEWRSLTQFSAIHLGLLEVLFAYWRELEVEGNPIVPEPAGLGGNWSISQGALSKSGGGA